MASHKQSRDLQFYNKAVSEFKGKDVESVKQDLGWGLKQEAHKKIEFITSTRGSYHELTVVFYYAAYCENLVAIFDMERTNRSISPPLPQYLKQSFYYIRGDKEPNRIANEDGTLNRKPKLRKKSDANNTSLLSTYMLGEELSEQETTAIKEAKTSKASLLPQKESTHDDTVVDDEEEAGISSGLTRWLSQDISIRRNSLRRSPVCVEKTKGDRGETPTRKLNEKEKEAIIMQDSEESTNLQEKVGSAGKRKKSEMDSPPESGDRAKREKSDEEMMIKSMLRVMKTAKRLKEMIAKTTNTRGDIRQASKDLDYHVDKLSVDLEGWQTNKRVSPRKPVERKEIGTQTEEEYKDTREIGIQACTEMAGSHRPSSCDRLDSPTVGQVGDIGNATASGRSLSEEGRRYSSSTQSEQEWLKQDISIRKSSLRRTPTDTKKGDKEREEFFTPGGIEETTTMSQPNTEEVGSKQRGTTGKRKKLDMDSSTEEGETRKKDRTEDQQLVKSIHKVLKAVKKKARILEKELKQNCNATEITTRSSGKTLYLLGIDPTVGEEEIKVNLGKTLNIDKDSIDVRAIRKSRYENNMAIVVMPGKAANELLKMEKVKLGWTTRESVSDELPTPGTMEGFTDEEPFVSAIYKLSGNASASELFSSDEDARPAFKGQKGKREREQMSPKKGKKKIKEDKGTKVSEDKEGSNKLNEFKKMYEKIMTEAKILSDLIRQHGNYTKMEIKDHVKEMRRWAEKGEMTLIEVEQERHTRREEKPRKEVKTCTVGTQTYLSGNEEEEEKESKEISEQVDRVVEYQDLEPLMNRHWPQATYKAIKEVEKTQDTYKDNTFVYLFDHRRDRSDGEGLELETVFPGFKEMIKTSKGDTEEMGNTQTITSRAGAKTTVKKVYMQPVTGDSVVCEETYKKLEGVLKGCKRNCNERGQQTIKD
ncbi:unnamed protein product [Phyllotreta striolata]|uniref:Uncharacterized protein n=1 Tax=Phyllotreta striolata TaxID=444603 RepID=A0A9P0GU47_PHYSR|nr:unnamed protein product [Phyllotreta striolata]